MRNVAVLIHVIADPCGADVFQFRRQPQLDQIPGHVQRFLGRQCGLVGTEENHMVHGMDRPWFRFLFVSGSIRDNVRTGNDVKLHSLENIPQTFEIMRVGDVDGNLIREKVNPEISCHRHVDDLPADQVRLGFFGPGKLINGQIYLKTQFPDRADDPFMGQGEGVKGSREERYFFRMFKGECAAVDAVACQETLNVSQSGGTVKERECVLIR